MKYVVAHVFCTLHPLMNFEFPFDWLSPYMIFTKWSGDLASRYSCSNCFPQCSLHPALLSLSRPHGLGQSYLSGTPYVGSVLEGKLREGKMPSFCVTESIGQVRTVWRWVLAHTASTSQANNTSPAPVPVKRVLLPRGVPRRILYAPLYNAEYVLLWLIFLLLIIQYCT